MLPSSSSLTGIAWLDSNNPITAPLHGRTKSELEFQRALARAQPWRNPDPHRLHDSTWQTHPRRSRPEISADRICPIPSTAPSNSSSFGYRPVPFLSLSLHIASIIRHHESGRVPSGSSTQFRSRPSQAPHLAIPVSSGSTSTPLSLLPQLFLVNIPSPRSSPFTSSDLPLIPLELHHHHYRNFCRQCFLDPKPCSSMKTNSSLFSRMLNWRLATSMASNPEQDRADSRVPFST